MSSKDRSFPVSPGTVLSVFCLFLYSAGFIRNELKFGDYDQRLMAVEEVIPKLKEDYDEMVKASNNEGRLRTIIRTSRITKILASGVSCSLKLLLFSAL